jgi:hypothetical protein
MRRTKANPNFTRGGSPPLPSGPTSFEEQVSRLGLHESEYVGSDELRQWCCRNCDRCYVPEWLLKEWNIHARPDSSPG